MVPSSLILNIFFILTFYSYLNHSQEAIGSFGLGHFVLEVEKYTVVHALPRTPVNDVSLPVEGFTLALVCGICVLA